MMAEEAAFTRALIEAATYARAGANGCNGSATLRRSGLRADARAPGDAGHLPAVAGDRRLACAEDGRHFRPNHHAERPPQIEAALERLSTPGNGLDSAAHLSLPALLGGRVSPRRTADAHPRHRPPQRHPARAQEGNQAPPAKQTAPLCRSGRPADFGGDPGRITAPGADYAQSFRARIPGVSRRTSRVLQRHHPGPPLAGAVAHWEPAAAKTVDEFLALKQAGRAGDEDLLRVLARLTQLREAIAARMSREDSFKRSQLRLADIGLEDYAFMLISECSNRLQDIARPGAWAFLLQAMGAALDNLRLGLVEPEECLLLAPSSRPGRKI